MDFISTCLATRLMNPDPLCVLVAKGRLERGALVTSGDDGSFSTRFIGVGGNRLVRSEMTIAFDWQPRFPAHRGESLRQGRDGERAVGQFLERLRADGAQVFHDIPGDGFNLDHVVISTHGIYAIETKTWSKPSAKASVVVDGDVLTVAGHVPDRNPMEQVAAAAHWLEKLLKESTGKRFLVRGVVAFTGWFVEQPQPRGNVWVVEPKMLPGLIGDAPTMISPSDVALAAFHLSRYVRSEVGKAA